MLKKILMGVLCVMMAFTALAGCDLFRGDEPVYALDSVTVYIKAEYEQEFEQQAFTVGDFEWVNVDRIVYNYWLSTSSDPHGTITIYLLESGTNEVLDAIEHFKTLEFVKDAETLVYFDGALILNI